MMGANVKRTDPKLWPLKLHYFLHGAGGSPILPFLPVIVKQMGMSGSAMGFILALNQVISLLARPLIGSIMDKNPTRKIYILRILIAIGAIQLYFVGCAPPIEASSKTLVTVCSTSGVHKLKLQDEPEPCLLNKLHTIYKKRVSDCHFICQSDFTDVEKRPKGNATWFPDGSYVIGGKFVGKDSEFDDHGFVEIALLKSDVPCIEGSKCLADCGSDQDLRRVLNGHKDDELESDFQYPNYWLIFGCWLTAAICLGCVGTYQDAFCHQILGEDGEALYGQQRMWASIGWGFSAICVGYFVDQASKGNLFYDYSIAFNVMLVLWLMDAYICGKISIPQTNVISVDNPLKEVGFSLIDAKITVFLLYCISVGFCYGALSLQFLLLEELGHRSDCNGAQAMKFLQGLCLTINCLGEIPVFFYSGKLIQRFGSKTTMHVVLLVFAIRFLYYSNMISPWQTLGVEMLNGLTTGLFYSSMTSFANQIAPTGSATTTTALAFTVTDGIGFASGAWVAGTMYQAHGASFSFACFGSFALVAFFLHIFAHHYISKVPTALGARPKEKSMH